jgi:hypothetical protein
MYLSIFGVILNWGCKIVCNLPSLQNVCWGQLKNTDPTFALVSVAARHKGP